MAEPRKKGRPKQEKDEGYILVRTTKEERAKIYDFAYNVNISASTIIKRAMDYVMENPDFLTTLGFQETDANEVRGKTRDYSDLPEEEALEKSAKRDYANVYLKETYKCIGFRMRYETDRRAMEKLDSVSNKTDYIRQLIIRDMKEKGCYHGKE